MSTLTVPKRDIRVLTFRLLSVGDKWTLIHLLTCDNAINNNILSYKWYGDDLQFGKSVRFHIL